MDGPQNFCTSDIKGKLLIDCSTTDTATNLLVKDHLAHISPSTFFYDAPVSGGVVAAEHGSIAFFLGCGPYDLNPLRLASLLGMMGK
jgi:3-hydroxyisobutyrate dehydrogenase